MFTQHYTLLSPTDDALKDLRGWKLKQTRKSGITKAEYRRLQLEFTVGIVTHPTLLSGPVTKTFKVTQGLSREERRVTRVTRISQIESIRAIEAQIATSNVDELASSIAATVGADGIAKLTSQLTAKLVRNVERQLKKIYSVKELRELEQVSELSETFKLDGVKDKVIEAVKYKMGRRTTMTVDLTRINELEVDTKYQRNLIFPSVRRNYSTPRSIEFHGFKLMEIQWCVAEGDDELFTRLSDDDKKFHDEPYSPDVDSLPRFTVETVLPTQISANDVRPRPELESVAVYVSLAAEAIAADPAKALLARKNEENARRIREAREELREAEEARLLRSGRKKKATRKKAARKKGTRKKATRKKATRKKTARKKTARKNTTRKSPARKTTARKKSGRKKTTRKSSSRKKGARRKAMRK